MNLHHALSGFNLRLPLVAAPMFIVSQLDLVISCCQNGIIGTFPALNQRTTSGFESWLVDLKSRLMVKPGEEALPPYGVNLIVHRSNPRLEADLEVCIRQEVPLIITSLGANTDVVERVHTYGGLVFHDVTNMRHARKAIDAGVDGLILVCAGAGGHAGILNPIPFVAEVRAIYDGVILLSGCLSTGNDIATALQMGADLAYMGTRFINTSEAIAPPAYQQMIIDSGTSDIIYTAAVSGVPANFIRQSLESAGITEALWSQKAKIDFGKEMNTETKAWKTLWSAGQGVATVRDVIPVSRLVDRLEKEFYEAIRRQSSWVLETT